MKKWSERPKPVVIAALVVAALGVVTVMQLPSIAAGAILHPARTTRDVPTPSGCAERTFDGVDVRLSGWHCPAAGTRRGSMVILHGVADTRASSAGTAERFARSGFDVVTYDSRAHGQSGGDFCTYGYVEKHDLRRVIDGLPPGPVVLIGTSLGGAVALQAAAVDSRVVGVVAAEVFSDLETAVRDRTPRLVPRWFVRRALRTAEEHAKFKAAEVAPVRAAPSIRVPVLLVHGARDVHTPPDHSQRILAALAGPKRLILVDGARHNESLRGADVWNEIEQWIDGLIAR